MSKTCSKCSLSFSEDKFLIGRSVCADCRSKIRKEKYIVATEEKNKSLEEKECCVCKEKKGVCDFRAGSNYCVDCHNKKRRESRQLKNQPILAPQKIIVPEGFKLCKDCLTVKKIDEFRDKRLKCKKCENKERVAYKKGEIQKQPIPEVEKEEDDFSKKLKVSCRNRIRETLPKEFSQKLTDENRFGYVYDFLNCDMNFLKRWLQFNYTPEMTDENYGTYWYLDHVIPIHTFNIKNRFEENKKNCYSWFNLSPLIAIENSRKFTGINKNQIAIHNEQIIAFCLKNKIEPDKNYLLLCAKHLDAGNPLESSTTTSL